MDLALVKKKINEGKYKSIHDAADDVRMIWKNCMSYNADGSDFYNLAQVSVCCLYWFVGTIVQGYDGCYCGRRRIGGC